MTITDEQVEVLCRRAERAEARVKALEDAIRALFDVPHVSRLGEEEFAAVNRLKTLMDDCN